MPIQLTPQQQAVFTKSPILFVALQLLNSLEQIENSPIKVTAGMVSTAKSASMAPPQSKQIAWSGAAGNLLELFKMAFRQIESVSTLQAKERVLHENSLKLLDAFTAILDPAKWTSTKLTHLPAILSAGQALHPTELRIIPEDKTSFDYFLLNTMFLIFLHTDEYFYWDNLPAGADIAVDQTMQMLNSSRNDLITFLQQNPEIYPEDEIKLIFPLQGILHILAEEVCKFSAEKKQVRTQASQTMADAVKARKAQIERGQLQSGEKFFSIDSIKPQLAMFREQSLTHFAGSPQRATGHAAVPKASTTVSSPNVLTSAMSSLFGVVSNAAEATFDGIGGAGKATIHGAQKLVDGTATAVTGAASAVVDGSVSAVKKTTDVVMAPVNLVTGGGNPEQEERAKVGFTPPTVQAPTMNPQPGASAIEPASRGRMTALPDRQHTEQRQLNAVPGATLFDEASHLLPDSAPPPAPEQTETQTPANAQDTTEALRGRLAEAEAATRDRDDNPPNVFSRMAGAFWGFVKGPFVGAYVGFKKPGLAGLGLGNILGGLFGLFYGIGRGVYLGWKHGIVGTDLTPETSTAPQAQSAVGAAHLRTISKPAPVNHLTAVLEQPNLNFFWRDDHTRNEARQELFYSYNMFRSECEEDFQAQFTERKLAEATDASTASRQRKIP